MVKRNWKLQLALIAAGSMIAASTVASAGEAEDALISKVVEAYGGEKLTKLKSIRIQDVYKTAFPGQGYTSNYVEFAELRQDAQIDIVNHLGSVESWSASWNFTNNSRTVSASADIATINYNTGKYQPASFPDYYAAFGFIVRVTDTLLAFELAKQHESAIHKGEAMYIGRSHELIEFEMPSSPVLTLYVDSESGMISKMSRDTGNGILTYQFSNHEAVNGVTYASDFEFFIGKDVNLVSLKRDVTINHVRTSVFQIDDGIFEESVRVDGSEMTVDEIAAGVHLAGTSAAYTMFVDAGDHIIATGGYAGLAHRFEAYKKAVGHDKPLGYQIVTHHHTDHLGGMADAFAFGAIFVTPKNAVANLNVAAGAKIPQDRLQIIDETTILGPMVIYDVATSHAASYALAYHPAAKTAFQADHYNSTYQDSISAAGIGAVTMKKAIDDLKIDVAFLLSAHGRGVTDWADFETAVAKYNSEPCRSRRAICAK